MTIASLKEYGGTYDSLWNMESLRRKQFHATGCWTVNRHEYIDLRSHAFTSSTDCEKAAQAVGCGFRRDLDSVCDSIPGGSGHLRACAAATGRSSHCSGEPYHSRNS